MLLFDAPNREVCMPKRSRTNTPLQALALMNEVTYVEASRALAVKMVKDTRAQNSREKINLGYRLATGRTPTKGSLEILSDGLEKRWSDFKNNPAAAKSLVALGDSKLESQLDEVELAAYTTIASILLNLDRVLMKD